MRNLLLATSAIAALAVAAPAFAEHQEIYNPVTSTGSVVGGTIGAPLTVNTQAVGNVISADIGNFSNVGPWGNGGGDSQSTDTVAHNSAITATTNVQGVTVNAASDLGATAIGNTEQINSFGNVAVGGGNYQATPTPTAAALLTATSANQSNGSRIIATTNVGNVTGNVLNGPSSVNAGAVGNSLTVDTNGAVQLGYNVGEARVYTQVNANTETSTVNLGNTTVNGALTSAAQSIGNNVDIDAGNGLQGGAILSQVNTAGQTSTANFNSTTLTTTGNTFGSSSLGNVANLPAVGTAFIVQQNTVAQNATTNANLGTFNGTMSAQAVGDAVSFDDSVAGSKEAQLNTGPQTAQLFATSLTLNADSTFNTTGVGNSLTGTQSPDISTGFWNQRSDAPQVSYASLSGVNGVAGSTAVNTTAVGNAASLSNWGGFAQFSGAPQTSTSLVSGSNFAGSLAVNTTAIGNSVALH